MDFGALLAAGVPEGNAPNGYNGAAFEMDLARVEEWVEKKNLIVMTEGPNPQLDLRMTWAYAIYAVQGFPADAIAVTAAHMDAAADRLADIGAVHTLLAVFSHLNIGGEEMIVRVRRSDCLSHTERNTIFQAGEGAVAAGPGFAILEVVDRLWDHLRADVTAFNRFYSKAAFSTMMLCMNAMHRELLERHNWFTDHATNPKTQTARCVAMAGASKDLFLAWVARGSRGHDLWHFLNDETLQKMAYILTGHEAELDGVDNTVTVRDAFHYKGELVGAGPVDVKGLFGLSESVCDRLPSGTVGVAGLIVGVQMVALMLEKISYKVTITNGPEVIAGVNMVKEYLSEQEMDRGQLINLKAQFLPIVATAVGFMNYTAAGRDQVDTYESLVNYVKQDIKNSGRGRTLAETLEPLEVTPAKLKGLIGVLFSEAIAAFKVCEMENAPDVDEPGNIEVGMTPEQQREARAAREEAVRMKRMEAEVGIDAPAAGPAH